MANRAGSDVTVFDGGSHLTLISHPGAVTAVIQKAIDFVEHPQ
ncbi:alpha/beta hydrolase [Mycobacterium tuberculosis]|nr:alpha/beta hydrolase [Mycobacterium tuberculosis]